MLIGGSAMMSLAMVAVALPLLGLLRRFNEPADDLSVTIGGEES